MPVAYAVARERLVMQPYFSRAKEAFRMKLQRIGLVLLVVLLLGSSEHPLQKRLSLPMGWRKSTL